MSPAQRAFFEDPSPRRFMRKGNKLGGTMLGNAEAAGLSLGIHPRIRLPTPNTGIYFVPDLDHSYADDVCRTFAMLLPPDALAPDCSYTDTAGYKVSGRRGMKFANGSKILFRSSHQQPRSQAGIFGDWGLINEPPAEHLWGEMMRAFSLRADTPLMMLATIADDMRSPRGGYGWLRQIIEGGGWSEHVVPLIPHGSDEDNPTNELHPWRTVESIRQQIANCPPWERAQRIFADWEAPALDRWLVGWDGTTITDADLPSFDVKIGLGLDHGELPGHEAGVIFCWWYDSNTNRPRVVVLDEYTSKGRTTVEGDALAIQALLSSHGQGLMDISKAVGDTNSAGKSRLTSVNREFEIAFGELLHGPPPFEVDKPRKGPGSISWGARILNRAFQTQQLFVHERCEQLTTAIGRWKGEDDDYKHLIDALRYGTCEILDPEELLVTPTLNVV